MNKLMNKTIIDNGGRRLGLERRQYEYTDHIPARRVHDERRSGMDRRSTMFSVDRRTCKDRRNINANIDVFEKKRHSRGGENP